MARYSIGRLTTNVTSGQAAHTLRTSASKRAALMEAGITAATAVALTFSLGRPAAVGITPTSPVVLTAEDAIGVCLTDSALAWATPPTNPTVDMRRWNGPATIGVGMIFTFPLGVIIPVSANFVLQNLATNTGGAQSYFVVEE